VSFGKRFVCKEKIIHSLTQVLFFSIPAKLFGVSARYHNSKKTLKQFKLHTKFSCKNYLLYNKIDRDKLIPLGIIRIQKFLKENSSNKNKRVN